MTEATAAKGSAANRSPWEWLACAASFALLCAVAWILMRRGINLSDEGFLLQQALDMLDGKVLYRDIEMFIAPGIWFVVAGLFSIVEPSVLASRLVAAVSYFGLAALIFRLVARRAGTGFAAGTVAVYAVLAVWSFPHWTWAWYSPYSILFALLAMHALLCWARSGRHALLVRVGVYVGLATVFKQNYGFFALTASALGIVAVHVDARLASRTPSETWGSVAVRIVLDGLRVGAGLLVAVVPLLAYFGYHGALWSIYDRFVLYPLEFTTAANIPYLDWRALLQHDVFQDRVTSTNYLAQLALNSPADIPLLPGLTTVRLLHALLYWLPPLVLLGGLVLSFLPARDEGDEPKGARGRLDVPMFVSTATSGLLFLGIFPRADFTHLVTVYQPLLVTGAFVAHRLARALARRAPALSWAPVTAGTALFGFYALAAAAWLLYLTSAMTERLPQARGGVYVHLITAVGINQLVEVVRAHTDPGDAFFGIPDMAMINFLAERDVPGSQYQTYAHMIARDEGALTTEQLAAADVDFVIARYDNVLSTEPRLVAYAPILADYLERHFEATWLIQNDQYMLLERRAEPKPPTRTLEATVDCTFAGGSAPSSSVRQHLLFASLFQPLDPNATQQAAETRCRVEVPDRGATLSFQLGYKRPIGIEPGATVTGEVEALAAAGEKALPERMRLFQKTLPVQSMNVDGVRVPEPERVDLSGFAGRDVTLVFRVKRNGRVKLSPFTLETYAVFWQNPVLELEER